MGRDHSHDSDQNHESKASANQILANENSASSITPPPYNLPESNGSDQPIQMRRSGFWNGVGDALGVRDNEEELDAYEDYLDAVEEKNEFKSGNHTVLNNMPSTGRGKFDAHYFPGENKLLIALRYSLNFLNGSATDYPDATAEELLWTDESRANWESRMQSIIYNAWSHNFTFYCQKKYWEELRAATSVVAYKDDSNPHFNFNVTKVPLHDRPGHLTFRGSAVTPPSNADDATNATLDSNDIENYDKLHTGSNLQTPIAHEAGHMLGLGDEYEANNRDGTPKNYTDEDPDTMRPGYAHDHLADEYLDATVQIGSDSRIMSSGDEVQPEHGVTFLEALKAATNMDEWGYEAKEPAPVPRNPDMPNYNDAIVPDHSTGSVMV